MQRVTDLDLPYLAIQEPKFAVDPIAHIDAARRQHPWLARSDFGYIVHEYQAIRELSYMDDKFNPSLDAVIEIMGAGHTPWGRFMLDLMLAKDPPEHTRLRNSVASSFTPRTANRLRPLMREVVSSLLDEWVPKGRFDCAEVASHFPVRVMFAWTSEKPSGPLGAVQPPYSKEMPSKARPVSGCASVPVPDTRVCNCGISTSAVAGFWPSRGM